MIDDKDLELKLCSNNPIFVDGVPIYPISINQISDIGYIRFNAELRLICLTADDVMSLTGKDITDLGVYAYLVGNALQNPDIMGVLLYWLSAITHCRVAFVKERLCFSCGAFDISESNFEEIQRIIRCRNGLQDINEEIEDPDNEAARRVLQRRKEERLKRRRAKSGGDDSAITLSDLVGILASGLGLTMSEVMGYDIYQFNDQFNRLKIMNDFEVSVQALLHGAKKEDVNLKHWLSKIKHSPEDT